MNAKIGFRVFTFMKRNALLKNLDAVAKWSAIICSWLLWMVALYKNSFLIFMAGFLPYLIYVNVIQPFSRK